MVVLESIDKLKRGERAPDFALPDPTGAVRSLRDYQGKKAVLVVFMCNHCPYVRHKIRTIMRLDFEFSQRGLQVIGINSNDPKQVPEDSVEGMKTFISEFGVRFPYLVDQTQEVARAFGASCTPDPFLLDGAFRLVYHGRFDSALEPGSVATTQDMRRAIMQLLAGEPLTVPELPSRGCSIKWKAAAVSRKQKKKLHTAHRFFSRPDTTLTT